MWKHLLALGILLSFAQLVQARPENCVLRDGKLFVNGQWVFLKIAKPLHNFANAKEVDQLIADLDILKAKHYNCLELNCYWHHFDHDADGTIDVSVEPLKKLVKAIRAKGMYPCLSVETYGVGGGQIAGPFWKRHPDAVAVDGLGHRVKDDEYGVGSTVPSIFSPEYLKASRAYIENLTRAVGAEDLLYFETTVEPQYMGNHALDFSQHAKKRYEAWLKENKLDGPAWPETFPVSEAFLNDPTWNRFKAESLADWVNGDAAAFRTAAGPDAYIAVDYLETCGPDMRNRNGDSLTFLRHLTCANIIQVNWHWRGQDHRPNDCAYRNVYQVKKETGRDWAVSEHMTINGSDYAPSDMEALLRNTIANSTHFGWEFVSVDSSGGFFSVYNKDWSPKPSMKVVEDQWDQWMEEIRAAEAKRSVH